jgi:hypothetical protein
MKRRREAVGDAPSPALEAQRRKSHELAGKMAAGRPPLKPSGTELAEETGVDAGADWFLSHVEVQGIERRRFQPRDQMSTRRLVCQPAACRRLNSWSKLHLMIRVED